MKQSKVNILIVDDEQDALDIFSRQLQDSYSIITANSAKLALQKLEEQEFQIVMSDVVMPDMDGISLLEMIKVRFPQTSMIMISGKATIDMVVKAMKLGAEDFIEKPVEDLELLEIIIKRILKTKWQANEIIRLKKIIGKDFDRAKVLGNSIPMQRLLEQIKRIAPTDITVLISGETGVGKELFAELIYRNSKRKENKFVDVNCGSIPETLLESVLFGHKKGAFTDAIRDKIGYFQEADGGTLFLDEITETSLAFQVKLLRVLEKKTIRLVGGDQDIEVDVRIVTATNKNIEEEVRKGNFREDLYYRLNVFNIFIPPLRDRIEDIKILATAFVREFSSKYQKELILSEDVMRILINYDWKGNIRELKNSMEHAVALANHNKIIPEDLPINLLKKFNQDKKNIFNLVDLPFHEAKQNFEKLYFRELLIKYQGKIQKVSQKTGIVSQNLYKKFNRYGLDPNDFRE